MILVAYGNKNDNKRLVFINECSVTHTQKQFYFSFNTKCYLLPSGIDEKVFSKHCRVWIIKPHKMSLPLTHIN